MMPNPSIIRPYHPCDQPELLVLFDLNIPQYFSADEREDLIDYLNHHIERYFVLELDGKIAGAGGINFSKDKTVGKISWDLFHPEYQGKGLGSQLTQYRIELLKQLDHVQTISVRTSQVAYVFYQKMGFELLEVVPDYWAKGFDLYRMKLPTNQTTR
ncbi:GNAT family N-acetyltransferase [Flavobacterium sp. HSC-61S13]|uniref:GNAT family N-acetyltransferase n=1 Tax=Flavobacterium sp. HSC-61S13 TaxID=2910963 RepID=UPI00209F518D|nr:GNAT family N-acetyltransferase [Flavobacterium sp. HSC-61S13]MCP1995937.1 GNAT superfamily N-acetyltransferase [Flavobacterium sp. HSC-61S13]